MITNYQQSIYKRRQLENTFSAKVLMCRAFTFALGMIWTEDLKKLVIFNYISTLH